MTRRDLLQWAGIGAIAVTDPAFRTEKLLTEWINGRDWFVRCRYQYTSPDGVCVVREGFVTDFASIPKPLHNVLPPTGPYGPAAVLHDFMYRTGTWSEGGPACTLRQANRVLHLAMIDLDAVPRWQRVAVDAGVGLGGWWTWRRYRRAALAAGAI